MIEQVVLAGAAKGLRGCVTGNAFRPLVPVSDHTVTVYKIDSIIQIVNDFLVEILFVGHGVSGVFTNKKTERIWEVALPYYFTRVTTPARVLTATFWPA